MSNMCINFNLPILVTCEIKSWETSRKIEKELQLGENSHLGLYTYLKEHYGDTADLYDFPNGEQVFAFYLSDGAFLPIIEKFNLPLEIKLNKGNDKFNEEILWCTYIGFYLVKKGNKL